VDEQQVALVADQREERGLAILVGLHPGQQGRGFGGDFATLYFGQGAPGGPAETHHLMKGRVAFERQRHGGELGGVSRHGCGVRRMHWGIVIG